jgi:hypothetical protein
MRVFDTPVDTYGRFSVLAHDDAGVGAAYEAAAISCEHQRLHGFLQLEKQRWSVL